MKQILLLMILPLPLYVFAQDALDTERQLYHPMLKEGKEWRERADHIVYTYSYDEEGKSKGLDVNTYTEYYAYSIIGDTLINGKNFKKLYLCAEDTSYYCAMYEDGAHVTYIPKGETNETMLYDFGHPVGEYVEWDEYWPRLYLLYEDAIEIGRQSFRRMNFTDEGEFLEDSVLVVRWVEGIGSSGGLFRNDEQGWVLPSSTEEEEYICTYFESCYEDGKCIFTSKDFQKEGKAIPQTKERVKFVEEGKRWTYFRTTPPAYMHFFSFFLEGDTVLGGKECKKLYADHYDYCYQPDTICFLGGLYEEDNKVYSIYNFTDYHDQWGNKVWGSKLLYDFSHQVGDSFTVDNERYHLKLVEIREGEIHHGQDYKVHVLQWNSDRDGWDWGYQYVRWIEGIGSTYEDLFQVCPVMGNSGFLTSVTLDGDTLFWYEGPSAYREYMMSVNHVTKDEPQVSGKRYDLSGRRIGSARKGQIIISDGKKIASP